MFVAISFREIYQDPPPVAETPKQRISLLVPKSEPGLDERSDVAAARYDNEDDLDDDIASSGEVFFSGAVTSNNPFAATENVDVENLTPAAAACEFNPFATITDDDQQEVFDPFQTIHDDDALNVPFSSEDRDTEDDATSPSRLQFPYIQPSASFFRLLLFVLGQPALIG